MPKRDKKQRHKAKRDAKRHALRRRESVGPLKRLATAPGEVECWMSDNFGSLGQMQLFAYKRTAGLTGLACFLLDQGVVGLKDAFTRINLDHAEFQDLIDRANDSGLRVRRATVFELRRWIAAGVRFASDNGMRLPRDWVKTASLIGGVGDWAIADVSEFRKEFAGHPEDLRQRLVAEPFETYVRRTDIDFVFNDEAPYMDQETGQYSHVNDPLAIDEEDLEAIANDIPEEELLAMMQQFNPAATALAADTAATLTALNQSPSPELFEAWRTLMLAAMLCKTAMPDAPRDDVVDFCEDLIEELGGRIDDARFPDYHRAVGQALEHLKTDPKLMEKAVLQHGLLGEANDPPA